MKGWNANKIVPREHGNGDGGGGDNLRLEKCHHDPPQIHLASTRQRLTRPTRQVAASPASTSACCVPIHVRTEVEISDPTQNGPIEDPIATVSVEEWCMKREKMLLHSLLC